MTFNFDLNLGPRDKDHYTKASMHYERLIELELRELDVSPDGYGLTKKLAHFNKS